MGRLDGRVAIVTGAGRGLGRAHALLLAREGAQVIVNDLGTGLDGAGRDVGPAESVVAEIRAFGGRAETSGHDVSDWDDARRLVDHAVATFGDLHVLVNNAGVLRDRTLVNLSEEDWDTVIRVHLKGHAAPAKWALAYWRVKAKSGGTPRASIVNTTSVAAFTGNFGQSNYSTAKAGLLGLSRALAIEGAPYGVRSNAVSPSANTRMAADDGQAALMSALDPEGVSPLVGWLAMEACTASSQVFHCMKGRLVVVEAPRPGRTFTSDADWSIDEIDRLVAPALLAPPSIEDFLGFALT